MGGYIPNTSSSWFSPSSTTTYTPKTPTISPSTTDALKFDANNLPPNFRPSGYVPKTRKKLDIGQELSKHVPEIMEKRTFSRHWTPAPPTADQAVPTTGEKRKKKGKGINGKFTTIEEEEQQGSGLSSVSKQQKENHI